MSNKLRFTKKEELANSLSHGAGAIWAIVAMVLMAVSAIRYGTIWHIVSFSVYGATLILLYLSSTFNHSLPLGSKAKDFFHNFDQIAIFLLIAGTYTPLALVSLRGDWGWLMFGIQWGFALTGILLKIFMPNKFEKGVNIFYIISYIIMGWLLLFFIIPVLRNLSAEALIFIFSGGVFYSLGVIFFKLEKIPYNHLIWHLFVITGSVLHWIAIYGFVLER